MPERVECCSLAIVVGLIAVAAFVLERRVRGVEIVARPRTHRDGARSCYVKDPDGNTLQVIHHPPISEKV